MWDRFALSVAVRHLRFGISQTLLTSGVVAASVMLIIFISSLIRGLQSFLIEQTTGHIPHITIRQPERLPIAAWQVSEHLSGDDFFVGTPIKIEQRKRKIEDWSVLSKRLQNCCPEITAVSPVVEEQAILTRGAKRLAVQVVGVIPQVHVKIVNIEKDLVSGRFIGINAGEIVVGDKLSEDFNLSIGDKIRLITSDGNFANYTVAGIFDSGVEPLDERTAYVTLRDAQSLFGLGTAVNGIGLKLTEIFEANNAAERLALQMPYEARSWMIDNKSLLQALRRQNESTYTIIAFTVLASLFGIASILITSVMSKMKEIGILKAMGATQKQIIGIFTLSGLIQAAIGAIVGATTGSLFSLGLYKVRIASASLSERASIFAPKLDAQTILGTIILAVLLGFLASLYPAKKAASVNAIEVIRGT